MSVVRNDERPGQREGQLIKPTFAQARWNCGSGYQGLQTEVVGKSKARGTDIVQGGRRGETVPASNGESGHTHSPVCRDLRGVQFESALRVRNGR